MSLTVFRKIQTGLEAVRGTSVVATKRLLGTLSVSDEPQQMRPPDERGSLAEFYRSYTSGQQASMSFNSDASYEQVINFLAMALKGSVGGVQQGVTPARLWTYKPNLTSKNNQDSFTMEYGDDTQGWQIPFGIASTLTFNITYNDALKMSVEMFGHNPIKHAFTAGLSDPTNFEEVLSNHAKIYIDDNWAGIGGTQKAAVLAGGTITIPTGLTPVKYADGELDFSNVIENRRHFELDLDLIMGADALTEYDALKARTNRAVRIEFEGSTISGAEKNTLTFDMIGQYLPPTNIFDEREGENLLRLKLGSHDVGGEEFRVMVKNRITAL